MLSLNDASPIVAFEAVIRGKNVYAADEEKLLLYELSLRHRFEESRHIQSFFTQALREKLGIGG